MSGWERTSTGIRVAHVITDLQTGGEATILSWLLPELEREGIRNVVITLAPDVHDRTEAATHPMRRLKEAGIPVIDLMVRKAFSPAGGLRLAQALRLVQPDVVHTYLFHAGIVARPVARVVVPHARLVSSVVSVDLWKTRRSVLIEAITLLQAGTILVNARAVADRLVSDCKWLETRIVVRYNGVDIQAIDAVQPGFRLGSLRRKGCSQLILVAGRLHFSKGPDIAMQVLARLRADMPELGLAFMGGGPMQADLKATAGSEGLHDRTLFLGALPHEDALAVLKEADLLLIPSRWEGIPAVVLEAFAAGTPVVASAVGGIPEIVVDGENGLLSPAEDVRSLSSACERILHDDALRLTLAGNARGAVSRFTRQRMIDDRLDLYRSIVRPRVARGS